MTVRYCIRGEKRNLTVFEKIFENFLLGCVCKLRQPRFKGKLNRLFNGNLKNRKRKNEKKPTVGFRFLCGDTAFGFLKMGLCVAIETYIRRKFRIILV